MSTPFKILIGDTVTPQARIPKSGEQTYLAPVTVDDSTGVEVCFEIEATIQQSGTAGYTGLLIDVTETSVGSGAKLPIDIRVGGATVFKVDNAGKLTSVGINDDATAQRLWLVNSGVWLGADDDATEFVIARNKSESEGSVALLGGYIPKDSALVRVYGRFHPTQGGDIELVTSSNVVVGHYDLSASLWTWTGNQAISAGDLAFDGGKGVDFNSGGTDILSEYKKQTFFTPTMEIGGSSVGITYAANIGRYHRFGDMVFFNLRMSITSRGGLTGPVKIAGLPIVSEGTANNSTSCPVGLCSGFNIAEGQLPVAFIDEADSEITMYRWAAASNGTIAMQETDITDTTTMYISGAYPV